MKILSHNAVEEAGVQDAFDDVSAVSQLLTGLSVLDPKQPFPPLPLLEHLETRAPDLSVFGPKSLEPAILKRVSEVAFANGQRQSVLEGYPMSWFPAGRDFQLEARTRLSMCSERPADLIGQMKQTIKTYMEDRASRVVEYGFVSKNEIRSKRLVRAGLSNFLDGSSHYYQFSQPWFEFRERLDELEASWKNLIQAAFMQGRILASEELPSSSRLCHPTQTSKIHYARRKSAYCFCFSSDLPTTWFAQQKPLHVNRREAGKWMAQTYQHYASEGRRPSVDDLVTVAIERFGLTENAARQAWRDHKSGVNTQVGEIPVSSRVSLKEIRELD